MSGGIPGGGQRALAKIHLKEIVLLCRGAQEGADVELNVPDKVRETRVQAGYGFTEIRMDVDPGDHAVSYQNKGAIPTTRVLSQHPGGYPNQLMLYIDIVMFCRHRNLCKLRK